MSTAISTTRDSEDRRTTMIMTYYQHEIKQRLESMDSDSLSTFFTQLMRVVEARDIPAEDNAISDMDLAIRLFGTNKKEENRSVELEEQARSFDEYFASFKPVRKNSFLDEEGGLIDADEAALLLNKSTQTVSRLFKQKRIIGIQKGSGKTSPRFFPKWQFSDGKLINGALDLIQALDNNSSTLIEFILSEKKQLNNQRPLDLLRKGELLKILALIEHEKTLAA